MGLGFRALKPIYIYIHTYTYEHILIHIYIYRYHGNKMETTSLGSRVLGLGFGGVGGDFKLLSPLVNLK